jgi:hypothetical protein
MTLSEQLDDLRQIVRMSSGARLLDLALINALDELAQAVQELRDGEPPRFERVLERRGGNLPGMASPGSPWPSTTPSAPPPHRQGPPTGGPVGIRRDPIGIP